MKTHPSIQSPQSPCHQEALHREDLRPPSVPQRRSAPHKLWFVDGLRQRPRCRRKAGPHYGVSRTGRRARQRIWLESPHPSPPLQTRPVPLPSLRVPELLPALRATSQYPHTLVTRRVGFSSSASSSKTVGEPKVILIEQAQIRDTVFQHGDSLYPHAKGETGVSFHIVVHKSEHVGINHARSQDLQPSTLTTYPAAVTSAHHAGHVYLYGRFCEGEKMGSHANATLLPKHSPNEDVQGPPQICQSNPFIHNQPFYLMEHGGVCRVRVSAVGLARTDNIYGRRLLLHDPDLNRRCVRPQEPFIIDEECVVQGACRMILWCVQSLKIIVFMLYFRAFCHPIAHPHENIFYLSAYTSHQMQMTGG